MRKTYAPAKTKEHVLDAASHLTSYTHFRKEWKCLQQFRVLHGLGCPAEQIRQKKKAFVMCNMSVQCVAVIWKMLFLLNSSKSAIALWTCVNIRCDRALGNPSLSPVSICSPFSFYVTPQTVLTKNIT